MILFRPKYVTEDLSNVLLLWSEWQVFTTSQEEDPETQLSKYEEVVDSSSIGG